MFKFCIYKPSCLLEADAKRTCLPTNSRVGTLLINFHRACMCVLQSHIHLHACRRTCLLACAKVLISALVFHESTTSSTHRVVYYRTRVFEFTFERVCLTRYEIRWMTRRNVYFIPRVAVISINVRCTGTTGLIFALLVVSTAVSIPLPIFLIAVFPLSVFRS